MCDGCSDTAKCTKELPQHIKQNNFLKQTKSVFMTSDSGERGYARSKVSVLTLVGCVRFVLKELLLGFV
jgi:uncharacterized metal-binding protein